MNVNIVIFFSRHTGIILTIYDSMKDKSNKHQQRYRTQMMTLTWCKVFSNQIIHRHQAIPHPLITHILIQLQTSRPNENESGKHGCHSQSLILIHCWLTYYCIIFSCFFQLWQTKNIQIGLWVWWNYGRAQIYTKCAWWKQLHHVRNVQHRIVRLGYKLSNIHRMS